MRVRRFLGTALFFCSAVFAYQSYLTSRPDPKVQELARQVLCKSEARPTCLIKPEDMRAAEINSFGHRYRWFTAKGEQWVNCRRALIVWGAWSCEID